MLRVLVLLGGLQLGRFGQAREQAGGVEPV